jgi:hypothetical protein
VEGDEGVAIAGSGCGEVVLELDSCVVGDCEDCAQSERGPKNKTKKNKTNRFPHIRAPLCASGGRWRPAISIVEAVSNGGGSHESDAEACERGYSCPVRLTLDDGGIKCIGNRAEDKKNSGNHLRLGPPLGVGE